MEMHDMAAGAPLLVLGSVNQDETAYVRRLPAPGETVLGEGHRATLGGKGANQAIAAAKLSATVRFVGTVGDDVAGRRAVDSFHEFDVDVRALATRADVQTGRAFITVDAVGENSIVVIPGANAIIARDDVTDQVRSALGDGSARAMIGLTQGELPAAAIEEFSRVCETSGLRFVLNLAPLIHVSRDALAAADPLILNRTEASELADRLGTDDLSRIENIHGAGQIAALLGTAVARSVVITLGAEGAVASDGETHWYQPSPHTDSVIDTTGAGDAFVGALCAELAGGATLTAAVTHGIAAGTFAVSGKGTTDSYATREQLRPILDRMPDRILLQPSSAVV
ncbi:ribokinase [Plantibacter sp. Mn2098]|uniref:ribokinase n=1 Tax=Plantibacter sp. Mn2098 TaxID=3395266 RepID=UPI003BE8185D